MMLLLFNVCIVLIIQQKLRFVNKNEGIAIWEILDLRTTMIYTHVINRCAMDVKIRWIEILRRTKIY